MLLLIDVYSNIGTDGYIHEAMMPIHCSLSVTLLMQTVILNEKKGKKDMWISELLNLIFALFRGKRK